MKLALASDIHLEFGDINLTNDESADVLILSGDICQARDAGRDTESGNIVRDFFQRVSFQFPRVLYVMGNHEHYGGDYAKSAGFLRNMFGYHNLNNVTLLDRECVTIDDYLFIGGTLWTDFNKHDPLTLHSAATMMNDYRGVKNTNDKNVWKFLPRHALEEHVKTKQYIKTVLDNRRAQEQRDNNVVVIGHHAPSFASVSEWYKADTIMNGCFASELTEFIMDYPEIKLWTHGHMHDPSDYTIGETRIVCNPRGYVGYEQRAHEFKLQYLEI